MLLFTLRCMSGLPSVLIGLFGYSVLILYLGIDKAYYLHRLR